MQSGAELSRSRLLSSLDCLRRTKIVGVIMTRELALVEISKPELVSKMHMRSLPYVPSCIALCAPPPPTALTKCLLQYKY